jgi:PEP-CTERM motif
LVESLEVHVFHRCVIAVIGVLAVSTSAAAGPIKFEAAPSFEAAELRSLDQKELRALFFRGGGARNAAASCADCLAANSRLMARDKDGKSAQYTAAFPFTAARLFKKPASNRSSSRPAARVPDLLVGPAAAADALGAVPLSSSEGASPLAVVSPAAVPEPNTLALIGTGLAGAWLLRRRRSSQQV